MKPVDQEVQQTCPQFWKIQLALKCDSHKTMGCPENLRQGGKRGKKKKRCQSIYGYCDYSMTRDYHQIQSRTTLDLFWVNLFSFNLCFLFRWLVGEYFQRLGRTVWKFIKPNIFFTEVYRNIVALPVLNFAIYLGTKTLKRCLKMDNTFSPACASWKNSFSGLLVQVTLLCYKSFFGLLQLNLPWPFFSVLEDSTMF